MITAIYPGTFDPITFGHIDIIKRASSIAGKLIIAIADDTVKTPIFSLEERICMVKEDIKTYLPNANIEIQGFKGLLVNFAKENDASVIIRGLRAVSDFEYEFQMAGMNSKMSPDIQTVFLPASENTHFIASRFVKEIVRLGGNVDELVSKSVSVKLHDYYNN